MLYRLSHRAAAAKILMSSVQSSLKEKLFILSIVLSFSRQSENHDDDTTLTILALMTMLHDGDDCVDEGDEDVFMDHEGDTGL